MKIVVLDGGIENPGDLSWQPLEALGELTVYDKTSYVESPLIAERIGDSEIVITNKTPLSRQTIEACPRLAAITTFSTGYNIIDCTCARERGIPVMNIPEYGTDLVSQYAIGLLLTVCCRIGDHDAAVHAGDWQRLEEWCFWKYPLVEIAGKTAGIIGLGRIGRATARTLRAMNVRVLAYNPSHSDEGREVADYVELDELYARSDFIFMHCPANEKTVGMIDRDAIAAMKEGVIFINNSRGQLVDEEALADGLNSGKIYGAGFDVVAVEPILETNPLLRARNCVITPHVSWISREARQRILLTAAENIRSFLNGRPIHVVNEPGR